MKQTVLLMGLFLCSVELTFSQPARLDPSFGTDGIVTADLGVQYDYSGTATKVLSQPDGSIYLILQTLDKSIITKRHPNGLTDTTYGNKGFTNAEIIYTNDAVLQTDGKLVLVGSSSEDFAVIRYNTNGTLDNTFSEDGRQTTGFGTNEDVAYSAAVQNDGKIVVAGKSGYYSYFGTLYLAAIVRYNTDGSLDNSFSEDGMEFNSYTFGAANAVTIQKDQRILVATAGDANSDFHPFLVRYKTNGSLDSSFGNNGMTSTIPTGEAKSIAIQSDGKIVAMGTNFNVARFNTDGSLDNDFSGDGKQTTDFDGQNGSSNSLAIDSKGKIVLVGYTGAYPDYNFALARYNLDGSLDNSFSGDGKQTTDFEGKSHFANSVTLLIDGKLLVAGSAFVRYNRSGRLDNTFNKDGKLPTNIHSGHTVYETTLFQKDGKIVVVGRTWNGSNFDSLLVRYNTNGSSDTTFEADEIPLEFTGHLGNDGKRVVVTGGTTISRYNADGSPDYSFSEDGIQQNDFKIASTAIQSDGKIVVAGSVSSLDSNYNDSNYINFNFTVARYNIDGSVDNSFSGDGKQTTYFYDNNEGNEEHVDSYAYVVAIKSDGEIVVVGQHSRYDHNRPNMGVYAYYNINGRLDSISKFIIPSNSYINGYISSITIGSNEKIVITCSYDYYPYSEEQGVVLVGSDFYKELDVPYGNYSVAIQNDGKIILGGSVFARYHADGSIDSTFGNNGKQTPTININRIAISDNKLYAVGSVNPIVGVMGAVARYLLDDSSNTSPIISITTPANNATYIAPVAHLKLSAAAFDKDGTISRVEFYNGTTLLHTETVAPYGFVWRNVSLGNYTITAKAYDNSGLATTSAAVHISVVPNKAPTVSIIHPANHKTYPGPATIHLEAAAKDPGGRITKVEFFHGSTLLQTELKPPYTFAWRNVPVGNYAISAKATDNWGAVTTSAVIHVSVHPNIAPTVSITSPANGKSFTAPAIIDLAASAQDADGRVTKVEFYNGTVLLRTERKLPYSYHWQNVPAGTYTITAVATDNYGLKTTSTPVSITVINATIVSSRPYAKNDKTALNDALQLIAFPNPANNMINIFISGMQVGKRTSISVLSSVGIVMKTILLNSKTQTWQMDVSLLAKGVYTIKVVSGEKAMYKKFVKL